MDAMCRLAALLFLCATTLTASQRTFLVVRQGVSHQDGVRSGSAISADGRYVAVASLARLAPLDTNNVQDIYVFDRATQKLTLETAGAAGAPSNGSSLAPQLSGDGQYLVFQSNATNLTPRSDANAYTDVFVRDRAAGTTRRLSVARGGEEPNGDSVAPVISDNGASVAFVSSATNLTADTDRNGARADIFLARLISGEVTRVSVDEEGSPFDECFGPSLDAEGRLVVFAARRAKRSTDRVRDAQASTAVYLRDTAEESTRCLSCNRGYAAFAPDISADGRVVAFTIQARAPRTDLAIHDLRSSTTTEITRSANERSGYPRLSADGRFLVFETWASNFLCTRRCTARSVDENVLPDVYVFDRETTRFSRVTGSDEGWWAPSVAPAIDGEGRTIIFASRQPYGPEDDTTDFDLFVCSPVCS
jgi:Tol biopolymer transport system component